MLILVLLSTWIWLLYGPYPQHPLCSGHACSDLSWSISLTRGRTFTSRCFALPPYVWMRSNRRKVTMSALLLNEVLLQPNGLNGVLPDATGIGFRIYVGTGESVITHFHTFLI